jgi:adenylate cyclase
MTDLSPVKRWLLTEGRSITDMSALVRGLAHQLNARGLDIARSFYGSTVLHPQVAAMLCRWEAGSDEVKTLLFTPSTFEEIGDMKTPMGDLKDTKVAIHYPLYTLDGHPYPDVQQLYDEGYTDYLLFPVLRDGEFEGGLNFCTKRPGGFTDDERTALEDLVPVTCAIMDRLYSDYMREQLLCAYLGQDAGRRVYRGQVRRGDQQTVEAAIWFSDLRGFTRLSESSAPDVVIEAINEAFEIVVESIHDAGGQVLKFMGDGLLGMFLDAPRVHTSDSATSACDRAVSAAREAQARLASLREQQRAGGRPETHVGVGLHYGDVTYGNIGAEARLDFTVIGRAVNIASRIEGLCSKLDQTVLASKAIADRATNTHLELVGHHEVKGVAEPIAVFAPTLPRPGDPNN